MSKAINRSILNVCIPSTVQYDSVVKSNCFPCSGPEFDFQFQRWVAPPLGDLTPSSGLSGCQHTCSWIYVSGYMYTHLCITKIKTVNFKVFILLYTDVAAV